ncbi:MAG: cysteine peptidase family C39 domain-containing protein [Pseudomonadota bacterium]
MNLLKKILNFQGRSKPIKHVRQKNISENGIICAEIILKYFGVKVEKAQLYSDFGDISGGVSLLKIKSILSLYGLLVTPYKCGADNISEIKLPCILFWKLNQYVILTNIDSLHYHICDPAVKAKNILVDRDEFDCYFSDFVLEPNQTYIGS